MKEQSRSPLKEEVGVTVFTPMILHNVWTLNAALLLLYLYTAELLQSHPSPDAQWTGIRYEQHKPQSHTGGSIGEALKQIIPVKAPKSMQL